ncbi:MAG: N-acetyl-gamma-glutamyl-phosphate reductase [Chloroflexi bacterium]|nr:N-acetyl-gamma-glutamyl-phosphate reductase [Chloroflexota bacterium]
MITIGIIGATGYTGLELLKLLQRHPAAQVVWLTSEQSAGQRFGDVFAVSPTLGNRKLIASASADYAGVDLVFCCLPHVAAQEHVAAARRAGVKAIDLSADFRLHDAAVYEQWYGHPHHHTDLLAEAVYGLPELHRAEIASAGLVANPGCYPTSVILGLAPLAQAGWLTGTVIADSKSGVSGAGRSPSLKTHFVEANENLSPYSIGRSHRHVPEMEQELRIADCGLQIADCQPPISNLQPPISNLQPPTSNPSWQLIFSPHLVPVSQGMLSTIYVTLPEGVTEGDVRVRYEAMYADEPFVYVLPTGQVATMGHTVRTNFCAIGLTAVPGTNTLIVTSSIDNLIKGASGQAVQNMNVMFGVAETTGLM